jgi:hypothetical protein
LSSSAALQLFLESRLRERLTGSLLCEVIWKPWRTPWGQCLSRPRASVRSTEETDSGLLPTPSAQSYGSNQGGAAGRTGRVRYSLESMARSGLWPTPTVNDSRNGANRTAQRSNPNSKHHDGLTLVDAVRLWPTPRASDCRGPQQGKNAQGGLNLNTAVRLLATPTSRDWPCRNASPETLARNSRPLSEQIGGQLNPAWVGWLMGYSAEWVSYAPSATRSSRKSPPK